MVLTFNCSRDGQSYVKTADGEAQNIVKTSHNPNFSGGVYDDLGLSCLVGIEGTDEGFLISAFDSPLGVFKPQSDCTFRMQGEGWEITKGEDRYFLSHSGEQIAQIVIRGSEVALSTEYSGQVIMVIAAALVLLESTQQSSPAKKPTAEIQRKDTKKKAEGKQKEDPIITINIEALKNRISKLKLDKAASVAAEYIPSIRFKVSGKPLIVMVSAIALCLVVFFAGLFLASSKNAAYQNVDYANATAKVDKSGKTTAIFKVGEYAYSIELNGYDYKNNETFLIYYTEKSDGTLNEHFMKKPSSSGFVTMSVVAIILAVVIFLFMFIGNPLDFRKELNLKELIKKLKPTSETPEDERLVEHTAYVSSAELEPDFFGVDSKEDNN